MHRHTQQYSQWHPRMQGAESGVQKCRQRRYLHDWETSYTENISKWTEHISKCIENNETAFSFLEEVLMTRKNPEVQY